MEQQHWEQDLRPVSGGANFDKNTELIGADDKGQFIDARNMRYDINDDDVLSKMQGEIIFYPALDNRCNPVGTIDLTGYKNIGFRWFFLEAGQSYHQIEFWAHEPYDLPTHPSLIRIDGIIVLYNKDFPITFDHPLQLDVNLTTAGGEIYLTDYNVPPMYFNLQDLMANSGFPNIPNSVCSPKYFEGFIADAYLLQLEESNNHPVFIQVTAQPPSNALAIGQGGLFNGLYQYQARYSTIGGDKSAWSVATPLIPVPQGIGNPSPQYPYTKTFGADHGTSTAFGIHFRLRVDNRNNYDYIEFKRTRYTDGAAVGTLGVEKLLDYQYPLSNGQLSVQDFWDFDNKKLELDLTTEANLSQYSSIAAAKTLRYFNSRLFMMNIKYNSKIINPTFSAIQGQNMFPVIHKMTTAQRQDGHKNPYNFAYYRSLMSGEKYGWAVIGWDNFNQPSFAIPVPNFNSFQMPDRRDAVVVGSPTEIYSDTPVKACNKSQQVSETFEVFDHYDAIAKSATTSGFQFTAGGGSGLSAITPTSQKDPNVAAHNYNPNAQVNTATADISSFVTNAPNGFGLNYYSLGMALAGIDLSLYPQIKSFSIVRTKPANRVIAQGLGYYSIPTPPNNFSNTKVQNQIKFYSPDIDNGFVNFQKIINNPSRYKLQLVSPLGFFTEVWGGYPNIDSTTQNASFAVDMINYARILRESGNLGNHGLNNTDTPSNDGSNTGVGIDANAPDGFGYTGFGKWRTRNPALAAPTGLLDIASIVQVTDFTSGRSASGGGTFYTITSPTNIFNIPVSINGAFGSFNNPANQDFLEPLYIVNIIDTQADIPQGNVSNYIQGGHYQKTEAIIGVTTGVGDQQFLLVDERGEDCTDDATTGKILFVRQNNIDQAWQDITHFNTSQRTTILNNIQSNSQFVTFNGTPQQIYGVYIHADTIETDTYTSRTIQFLSATKFGAFPLSLFLPAGNSQVVVRYDMSQPVKAFIGDTQVHEAIFSPFDIKWNSNGTTDNSFPFSTPFPYTNYQMDVNYHRPYDCGFGGGGRFTTQNIDIIHFVAGNFNGCALRQICAIFTCESRISMPYEFELNPQGAYSNSKYFPATNYIARPLGWNAGTSAVNQPDPFFQAYEDDYPQEYNYWYYGGFRYVPAINLDYTEQEENQTGVSKPKVGFVEVTDYGTAVIWSPRRPPGIQNAPSTRTFPALNLFVISDETGVIKYAYDDLLSDKGNNLYAFTQQGVCMLITDKTLLYSATGQQIAAIGNSDTNVILQEYWVSKKIGLPDEFWRSATKGYEIIKTPRSYGPNAQIQTRREDALFFGNRDSIYKLSGGYLQDIGRGADYLTRLAPLLAGVVQGYGSPLTGYYDTLQDEYFISIGIPDPHITKKFDVTTFGYNEQKEKFFGWNEYSFDRYVSYNNLTFGVRNMQTYQLNQGYIMNGSPITCDVIIPSAKEVKSAKEFGYQETATNGVKPTKIYYFDDKDNYVNNTPSSVVDTVAVPLSIKDYKTMSNYIPRRILKDSLRQQGRQVIAKIEHVGASAFKVITVNIKFKKLK